MKSYHIINKIGHFRVPKTITFKMRPIAQPFLWKWVLFAWERKHFHIKGWALNLVLIQRPRGTRKWPILEFTLKAALQGCLPFKQTTQVEILCINITQENLRWCENDRYNPNQLNKLKRVEILHRLRRQPIFSEASQTEWREPFDFQPKFSGFPCK